MAFLKVETKAVLVEEEMWPAWFYHPNEIAAIKAQPDFYSFSQKGLYRIVHTKVLSEGT